MPYEQLGRPAWSRSFLVAVLFSNVPLQFALALIVQRRRIRASTRALMIQVEDATAAL